MRQAVRGALERDIPLTLEMTTTHRRTSFGSFQSLEKWLGIHCFRSCSTDLTLSSECKPPSIILNFELHGSASLQDVRINIKHLFRLISVERILDPGVICISGFRASRVGDKTPDLRLLSN